MIGAEGHMPTREEMLVQMTYKDVSEVEKRVFYTLSGDSQILAETAQAHRNSKSIGLLFKTLIDEGLLTEEQLDEILFEVVT
jgi:hypothetical protein